MLSAAAQSFRSVTHKEDAVNFVMDVFRSMGGTINVVAPRRRPGHYDTYSILTVARDNFMMDFENSCLSENWDDANKQHPTGILRHADAEWATMIKSQVYPHHSDVDWQEYCEWVFHGGGDECFRPVPYMVEDDDDERFLEVAHKWVALKVAFLARYYEAQTRQRTAYLCKDMVRPLSTPLDDRITALALHINGQPR